MAGQKWLRTKDKETGKPVYPGVRYYKHPTRKHGVGFDRYFAIRYQATKEVDEIDPKTGKKKKIVERKEEGLGWSSQRDPADGQFWTEKKAALVLERLQSAAKHGVSESPTRLAEQRQREQARREAEEKAKQEENTRKEAEQKYTLKELLKTYIAYLKTRGKEKTAKAMESCIKCHLLEADQKLADTPAARVTSEELVELIGKVKEAGHDRTAGILRSTLLAAYNCALHARLDPDLPSAFRPFKIIANPVVLIKAKPVNAGQRVLTEDELKTFILALGDTPLDLAIKVALFSGGQRMAQLLRAEVIHWDAQNRTLLLYDGKGKRRNAREHLIPLQGTAAGIVQDIMKTNPARWLFSNDGGKKPIHEATTGKHISQIVADKKMADFDYRDIRRTCETMLASLGVSKDIRAQLLSHGISGVQAVHYDRHDYLNEKRAALVKWEHHLNEIVSGIERKVIDFPK